MLEGVGFGEWGHLCLDACLNMSSRLTKGERPAHPPLGSPFDETDGVNAFQRSSSS